MQTETQIQKGDIRQYAESRVGHTWTAEDQAYLVRTIDEMNALAVILLRKVRLPK